MAEVRSEEEVSDRLPKFMLVIDGDGLHPRFTDRLTRYMDGLSGTPLTHVALTDRPDQEGLTSSVIVEWYAPAPPDPSQWADALTFDVDQLHWYAVSEVLRWDRPGTSRSSATGISHICCVGRSAGLTETEFEHHWTQVHRPLAQRHHFGMGLYVQNVVRGLLGSSGQGIDGIAELGFRSIGAFREEMYDSDAGREAISTDVSKFVGTASCGLYRLVSG
jgi:uncharacterized protein (TIGR02118 family)